MVQEKKPKVEFQDGCHGVHPGLPNGRILAIFDLQGDPILPSMFQFSWPLGSEEEGKIDFQDGGHGIHLGFPTGRILAMFDRQVTQMLQTKFRVNWPMDVGGVGF